MFDAKHGIEGYKAPQVWAVEQCNCVLCVMECDGAQSSTFRDGL